MSITTPKLTLSPRNQFVFVCPIFQVQSRMSVCMTLRELVWRGKRPEKRQGCQACMHANKCPINTIVWRMIREKDDPYGSVEPKLGKLQDRDLDRIDRVLVPDRIMNQFALSDSERRLIVEANQNAGKRVRAKTQSLDPKMAVKRNAPERQKRTAAPEPTVNPATTQGNAYADAINQAMERNQQ